LRHLSVNVEGDAEHTTDEAVDTRAKS
jgi:hypothetical protein